MQCMASRRNRLVAVIGIVIAVLTLRAWRQRRTTPETIAHEHGDLETATEHATAATEHARVAAKKAINRKE